MHLKFYATFIFFTLLMGLINVNDNIYIKYIIFQKKVNEQKTSCVISSETFFYRSSIINK